MTDLPQPIYLHCHHGKHRSPAAAVVAAIGAGKIPRDEARRTLELAGTSPYYRGLYQAAETAVPIPLAELRQFQVTFVAQAEIPRLAETMVEVERVFERLDRFRDSQWRPLENHPDLTASHEALLLREHFAELIRLADKSAADTDFWEAMSASRDHVHELEKALETTDSNEIRLNELLRRIDNDCKSCHRRFRDVPLTEKQNRKGT